MIAPVPPAFSTIPEAVLILVRSKVHGIGQQASRLLVTLLRQGRAIKAADRTLVVNGAAL